MACDMRAARRNSGGISITINWRSRGALILAYRVRGNVNNTRAIGIAYRYLCRAHRTRWQC